jgi:hypothetical protein
LLLHLNISTWHQGVILGGLAGIFLHSSFSHFVGMRLFRS